MDDVLGSFDSPIKPWHVDVSRHFYDAFGNNETEISAHYIALLCQERFGWFPFTRAEIESLYTRRGPGDGFYFNHLISNGWIVEKDGKYHITRDFIASIYKSSPVTNWRKMLSILAKSLISRVCKTSPAK